MKVIVCLDNHEGLLFNHRRQAKDRLVIADIIKEVGRKDLYLSPYSKNLFVKESLSLQVSADFLLKAGTNDYCFVEDQRLLPFKDSINTLIIYHWNRDYPSDFYLDYNAALRRPSTASSYDFPGYSHERITKEILHF